MKNRIFRIIVPAVLAGIALALSLYRIFLSAGGGEDSFSMTAVPVAAALLLGKNSALADHTAAHVVLHGFLYTGLQIIAKETHKSLNLIARP